MSTLSKLFDPNYPEDVKSKTFVGYDENTRVLFYFSKETNRLYLIDEEGNEVKRIEGICKTGSFKNGYVPCLEARQHDHFADYSWGYIDAKGNWAVSPQFDKASDVDEEGYAEVKIKRKIMRIPVRN